MTNILGPKIAFVDLIDYCLDEQEDNYDSFPLRPSSVGRCSRALCFELFEWQGKGTFPKEKKDPATKRLLSLGNPIEYQVIRNFELIQKVNPNFRVRFKQQYVDLFPLPNNQWVGGSMDFTIMNRELTSGGVYDSKSKNDKFSYSHKSKWDETTDKLNEMRTVTKIGDGEGYVSEQGYWVEDLTSFLEELNDPFFADNFEQVNLYACSGFSRSHGIDHGGVIQYNKNDSRLREVRFKPSPELFKKFEDKCLYVFRTVESATKEDLLKLRCDFFPGNVKHAFCPCRIMAGEDQKAALDAYFKTFPKKTWPTDVEKIEVSNNEWAIDHLFDQFEEGSEQAERAAKFEQEICRILMEKKISKVRLKNGHVYELRNYKSGGVSNGPRVALKRSKA